MKINKIRLPDFIHVLDFNLDVCLLFNFGWIGIFSVTWYHYFGWLLFGVVQLQNFWTDKNILGWLNILDWLGILVTAIWKPHSTCTTHNWQWPTILSTTNMVVKQNTLLLQTQHKTTATNKCYELPINDEFWQRWHDGGQLQSSFTNGRIGISTFKPACTAMVW